MDKNKKIAVLGGDIRFENLSRYLKADRLNNFDVKDNKSYDILILPLPCTLGNTTILNSPENVDLKDVFASLSPETYILAGKISQSVHELANKYNLTLVDYYTDEFEVLNAVPSAEGAIKIALERTDFTICGSSCLVLGFGRIGKILSKMLFGIGANVTVAARRSEVLAMAKSLGFTSESIYDLKKPLEKADIIFNTIPSLILDQKNLLNIKKDALIIDLASKPGGCDFESAKALDLNIIHALGLPGIIAPKTSSEILTNCICSLIERRTNGS